MSNRWDDIISQINKANNIVILTHTNMDGDALGSSSALCYVLREKKKNCFILIEDDVPAYLNIIKNHDDYFVKELPFVADVAIAIDCGDRGRIEKRVDAFNNAKVRLCIDHHMQTGQFAEFSVVEPDISATGMLIYELIKEMQFEIDKELAEYLYVAISTDTGSFKFRNTNAKTHLVVAELYTYGIEATKLCNAIYSTRPLSQLQLEGYAVEHVDVFAGGKAALTVITQDILKKFGTKYEHADTVIDCIRNIQGVEISCVIKETEDGIYKASLRAKEYADVNKVASNLGGGGHLRASGCTFNTSLQDAINSLKTEIEKAL